MTGGLPRVVLRVAADAAVVGVVLFAGAGTLAWPRAWVLLAVLLLVRTCTAVAVHRVHPALLRERATVLVHRGQPWPDRLLLLVFLGTAFAGVPALAAGDVFRWHLLPAPPAPVAALGLALFAIGWLLVGLALRANAFAVTVVRLQRERRHAVVDAGVYAVVRHPMYAGNPCVLVGLGLWLGSYAAALGALVPLALLVARIALEERFLRRALPEYAEYAARVRYRLVPGVW